MSTVREARTCYFEATGFSTSAYEARVFPVRVGPITLRFPNPGLLPLHDLHHIVTGYGTDLVGEAEISVFELRSGCRSPMVFFLCLSGIAVGLLLAPRRILRAWKRARGTTGLYHANIELEDLLWMDVLALRTRLGIPAEGLAL